MKRRQGGKIAPKFKKQPKEKKDAIVGIYSGIAGSRFTRKSTYICPEKDCSYTSRRFYCLDNGHENLPNMKMFLHAKESVCSIVCPIHRIELILLGDVWRLPKKGKKREKQLKRIKKI